MMSGSCLKAHRNNLKKWEFGKQSLCQSFGFSRYFGIFTIIFLLCFFNTLISEEARYKLYCFYTPDFEVLYTDWFLPSLKDDFEVVTRQYEQECPLGAFGAPGWKTTMFRKLEMLRDAVIEHQEGKIFFYSDIDIIFFRPILNTVLELMGECDFVAQQGWSHAKLCAGFLVIRGNQKTKRWIDRAIALMQEGVCDNDQKALRKALEHGEENLLWKFLPALQFPNGRRVLKKHSLFDYAKEIEIDLDDSILLFHANCAMGLKNKLHFLTRVKELYENKVR